MQTLLQSSTDRDLVFVMYDSADHVTGKTGLSPTVVISKNGGSFASPSGVVSEIGNGFYKVAGNATDSNTRGTLALSATDTGADQATMAYDVVAYNPNDAVRLGLTALPNAAADAAGGLPISDAGGLDLDTKLANTDQVTTARMAALTDWINGGRLDLLLDAIKASTDNLPADPADESLIIAATDQIRTDIAALPTPPTATENADALLKRDWTSVTGEAARSVLNALRFLRNKWSMSGATLTVTKENDTDSAWTAEVTTNASADPITGSDPA